MSRLRCVVFAILACVVQIAAIAVDVTWDRVRYVGGWLSSRVGVDDPANTLTLMSGRVVVRLADGQSLEIPAESITFLGYSRDAVPDTGMIGLPTLAGPVPIFYMGWVRKAGLHYIAIDHARADGTSARILLQADKKNYGSILAALSGATGLPVSLTSQDRKHLAKSVATTALDSPLRRIPGVPAWRVDSLAGHRKEVRGVAFSADGSAFASVEGDGTVLVWNLAERRVTSRLLTRQPDTAGIALAPDGKSLAVWSMWKGGVSIWEVATQRSLGQIAGSLGKRVHTVAFSPQAQTLAVLEAAAVSSRSTDTLRLWRLPSLQEAGQLPAGEMGRGLIFSTDGTTLTYWSWTGEVFEWTVASNAPARIFRTKQGGSIGFGAYPALLALQRGDRTVSLWDVEQGALSGVPLGGHFGNVRAADFSADGRRLSSTAGGHAIVWDLSTRQPIGQCLGGSAEPSAIIANSRGTVFAITHHGESMVVICSESDRQIGP